tara:strand:- start:775 stop:1035 length:261 start_codon:yes stop_codon:yes gene_type:complete
MIKEIKYLIYILVIFFFIFFSLRFYFSENNKKNYFRSINLIDEKIKKNEANIIILPNDTKDIIEYLNENIDEDKKEYTFWELLKKN